MAPQGFLRFLLRRLWCTTLFFIALIIAVFTATSVYYAVRINLIEKHLNARTLNAEQARRSVGDGGAATAATGPSHAPALPHGEAATATHPYHPLMSRATPAGHSELAGRLRRSTAASYDGVYKVLMVNVPMSRQAVRNPTLPETIPLWENVTSREGKEVHRVHIPARQRYVLQGLEVGKQYMLRLSYLGSPSVAFEMLLYQVRQSQLERWFREKTDVRGWSAVPQDTELRIFAMSATDALQFDYEEEVWVDELNDDDDEDKEEVEDTDEKEGLVDPLVLVDVADPARTAVEKGKGGTANRYLPVVEVRPRALSIPIDSSRLPVVRFNLALEPLSSSLLPQVAVPLITYTAWVVVFVGYLCIYTFVSTGIAGGRLHTRIEHCEPRKTD
jgi:hypothetical protein